LKPYFKRWIPNTNSGETVLHTACRCGQLSVIKLILNHHQFQNKSDKQLDLVIAKLEIAQHDLFTQPIHLAKQHGHFESA